MKKTEMLPFLFLLGLLVPLEVMCAFLAYETLGEVDSTLYFLAVGINLVFIIMFALKHPVIAATGVVLLGLLIVPYQLVLGHRLLQVEREAAGIVSYAYEQKVKTGEYPADLSGYEFRNRRMKAYIQDYRLDEASGEFAVTYRVGTESTSHWYSPKGGWGYYPD